MTTITREQVLEAAAQVFREKGFHAASMQDIAKTVKLQKASLYHHVSSKQEMLVDILDQALDVLIERMQTVVEQTMPPEDKLRLAVSTYLQALTERPNLASVLLLEHRSLDAEYHQRHIPRRDRFENLWLDILNEGVNQGTFICKNPSLAVKALLGIVNWTIMWYRPDGDLSPAQIATQSADLFLNGLCVRE
ncbi:MAG: TetR/AcrR family transcriptional regulator [Anaerolineae bacterium]|nr:TetR/AcrR family transcriptional regulator [Anaerolineae bacterium]